MFRARSRRDPVAPEHCATRSDGYGLPLGDGEGDGAAEGEAPGDALDEGLAVGDGDGSGGQPVPPGASCTV